MNISDIKPYPKNAKKHPKKQIQQVANSIKEFGFNQPIVIDKDNVIIVGHGRLEAAKLLGLKDVPVVKVDLSEEKAKAYRLADNKLNESEWDMGLAIEELKELSEEMFNLTGFDKDLIIEDDEKDDMVPTSPSSRTVLGDIWALGEHKIICGDSTSPEVLSRLMGEIKADLLFTDPPYNIAYKGQGKNTSNEILGDDVNQDEFQVFLEKVFQLTYEYTKTGAGGYIFHSPKTQILFENAIKKAGYDIKFQLIWNKPTAGLGMGDYRWKHEPFFYVAKKNQKNTFYGDRTHSTVWDFQKSDQQLLDWAKKQKKAESEGKTTVWTMKRDPVGGYVHPTQKPVELITYALVNNTKSGDVVLDLFLGSGSTLIAAEKTQRVCYGVELDPEYIDTVIERWEDYTGGKAEKVV